MTTFSLNDIVKHAWEDIGNGFAIGAIGSSFTYFINGAWHAPRKQRIYGGLCLARDRACYFGGSIAMWAAAFSVTGGLLKYYR